MLTDFHSQPQPSRTAMHRTSDFRQAVQSFTAADIASSMSSRTPHVTSSKGWSVAGRLLIAQGAVDACKVGTAIAIRYSCKRPQFGEKMIMEYITQQRRLLPGLATTYAMQVSMMRLRVRFILVIVILVIIMMVIIIIIIIITTTTRTITIIMIITITVMITIIMIFTKKTINNNTDIGGN